jgi:3-oxoacyl-[acyl-carrier-protein] synthase-3
LVIGAETLSRVVDKVDRDSMIFSDGAGAVIVEKSDSENGVIAYKSVTYTDNNEIDILNFEHSYDSKDENKYIKMKGRKVYEFALKKVPEAMKECIEKANVNIDDIKKIFIHQANMKMDDAIVKRLYSLYNKEIPKNILPMNIQSLGNSSVATIPTLFDQVLKGKIMNHKLNKNDLIVFASVGAGMNVNAMVYKI